MSETAMKSYFRVTAGNKGQYIDLCRDGNFISVDVDIDTDLTGRLPDDWHKFNREFIPVYLKKHPEKEKISAGLACGNLWTVAKGIKKGDIVLCPDRDVNCLAGEVTSDYFYYPGELLPHRRQVRWFPGMIPRDNISRELIYGGFTGGFVSNITKFAEEIEALIAGNKPAVIVSTDETVEDPATFALEKHLEEFLVQNWKQTEFGKKFDIYQEDGRLVGQQFPSDTGPIDILAISKDKKELLVVELKKGRASDHVVGQVQRYMGYVQQELVEEGQTVKGVIIALEDDIRIRRALSVARNIEFFRYQVSFKLFKS